MTALPTAAAPRAGVTAPDASGHRIPVPAPRTPADHTTRTSTDDRAPARPGRHRLAPPPVTRVPVTRGPASSAPIALSPVPRTPGSRARTANRVWSVAGRIGNLVVLAAMLVLAAAVAGLADLPVG